MRGFIELHDPDNEKPFLINVNQIVSVNDGVICATDCIEGDSFYTTRETYGEIKWKIEEASAK